MSAQSVEWYITHISETEYALLVNAADTIDETQLIAMLEEKYHLLECSIDATVTTGVSLCKEATDQLHDAFEEAEVAMSHSFFANAGELIRYSAVQESKFDYTPFLEHNLSSMVIHYVSSGGTDLSPADFVAQILDLYGINRCASIEIVNCFRYEMLNALYKTMVSYQYTHMERYNCLACILTDRHVQEFECHIVQILTDLCQKHHESDAQKDVCSQARKYIQMHFDQSQLSLESIAEHIGCSSSYLSRAFKQKYGVSIISHIAEVRIGEAKLLLETTDESITDIATRTGYLSSNTFVKSFKKIEGTTPTAYRSLKRSQNPL